MAVTIPVPGQIVLTAATDAITLNTDSAGMTITRMQYVTNGTGTTDFEILDASAGRRIAFLDAPAANATGILLENARVKGIYVNSIPTDAEIHIYHT